MTITTVDNVNEKLNRVMKIHKYKSKSVFRVPKKLKQIIWIAV